MDEAAVGFVGARSAVRHGQPPRGRDPRGPRPSRIRNPTPRTVSICRATSGPQLPAEEGHVGVHGIGRHGDPERPGMVQQLVPREDLVRVPHQRLEQGELARAQVHRSVVHRHGASDVIEGQVPQVSIDDGGAVGRRVIERRRAASSSNAKGLTR